jgi:nucleoside-diphosphate-sugar epimerase
MSEGLVLLTGASGFIGFAVLVKALQQGYNVRAVVRSEAKAHVIRSAEAIQPYLSAIEFVAIPDFLADGAFDGALKNVDHVIHVAAGLPAPDMDYKDPGQVNERLIKPNYEFMETFLHAAKKNDSIKRMVITSSAGAMVPQLWDTTNPDKPTVLPIKTFSADTPPPRRSLKGPFSCVNDAYHVSKALGLQQTLDFVTAETPHFSIINVMPTFTIGRKGLGQSMMDYLTSTNAFVLAPLLGFPLPHPFVTPASVCHIDDVAAVHVAALDPKIEGNRNFGISNNINEDIKFDDAKEIVKDRFPEAVEKGVFTLTGSAPNTKLPFDATKTEEVFGMKFKGFDEAVVDMVSGFLEVVAKQ